MMQAEGSDLGVVPIASIDPARPLLIRLIT